MDQNKFTLLLVLFAVLSLSACTNTKILPTLDAIQITSLSDNCEALYKSHIDAWDSREPENLRGIYTDDIVHFDGEPLFVGIDEVVNMPREMYLYFPNWQMQKGNTYISKESCLGTWINWDVFGFTQDDPGMEYDILEHQDSKISFWQAFYSQNFHQAIDNKDLVDDDFLSQFASSWSSGNTGEVVSIYAQDAELVDSLYGISVVGKQGVKKYANSFFAKSSKAKWELLYPFAESEIASSFTGQSRSHRGR